MPGIGILTCQVLEQECAYLVALDASVSRITVLENGCSDGLVSALHREGRQDIQLVPHLHSFRAEPDGLTVVAQVLPIGLHRTRQVLRTALHAAAQELSLHCDVLLLGYGRCGAALDDPRDVVDVRVPVFYPEDNQQPVEDCVGLLIGGRERYHAEQRLVPGTFFITPGWAMHGLESFGAAAPETIRRVFARYERALLIATPVMDETALRERSAAFTGLLGLRTAVCAGTIEPLLQAWDRAKTAALVGAERR
jgi:hypothetical protein